MTSQSADEKGHNALQYGNSPLQGPTSDNHLDTRWTFNKLRRPLSTYPGVVAFRLQLRDLFLPLQQVFARLVQFLGQRRKLLQNKT